MKKLFIAAILLPGLIACGEAENKTGNGDSMNTVAGNDNTDKDSIPVQIPDSAAAMQAWMTFMTPGEMHNMLAKDDGTWNEEISMWMAPGAPPQTMKASCTNKMILGGRYQQATHKGNMMGMPFEGISTVGYDNGKKKFVMSWADNMGTGLMNMEGDYDAAGKVIRLKGTQTDPITGKPMNVRQDVTYKADGSQLVEMYGSQVAGAPEYKVMEIKVTKK